MTHYNSKTERCHVLVGYYHGGVKPNPSSPLHHSELLDAFERREIASFSSQRLDEDGAGIWCRQTTEDDKRETTSPPCQQVGQYVARLMRE